MSPDTLDLPWYLDLIAIVAFFVFAVTQGTRIVLTGHSAEAWMRMVGWSGLVVWWGYRLWDSGNVKVSAFSMACVLLIGWGGWIAARRQIKLMRADIRCIQNPEHRCFRRDRIRKILSGE